MLLRKLLTACAAPILVTSAINTARAAIQGHASSMAALKPPSVTTSLTREALRLPIENRVESIREQGPQGYRNLVALMQDETQPMETRWRAVTAIGRIGGKDARPELEKALTSRDWYLRNAGLLALTNIDRNAGLEWARILISDKALMVRVAAVDALASLRDAGSLSLLWEKLNASQNFKGKQSLFIRRRIVETLATLETAGQEARFVSLLGDRDESLHTPAIEALERITRTKLGGANEPLSLRRERWQSWWRERSTRSAIKI